MNHSPLKPWLRFSSLTLIVIGVVMLGLAAAYYAYAAISWSQLGNMVTGEPASLSGGVAGSPVGTLPPAERIVIPAIGVDSGVMEIGVDYENGEPVWERPIHAVGHVRDTANPGEAGNVVMAGHLSSYIRGEGDVFHRLPEVKPGDEVWLYSPAGKFIYQVVARDVVAPDRVDVMSPTTEPTLTLITCVPDYVYSDRLIVTARLVRAP